MGGTLSKQELRDAIAHQQQNNDKGITFLTKSDERDALNLFGEAFQNDPLVVWVAGLAPDDPRRSEKLLKLSTYMLSFVNNRVVRGERGCALGIHDENGKLAGCTSLVPNSCSQNIWDLIVSIARVGAPPFSQKGEYCLVSGKRLQSWDKIIKLRREHMKDANRWIYLPSIGVATAHQHGGKGYGSKMLRLLNSTADTLGVPIYLETESSKLESMYMHFGYRTVEKFDLCVPGDESSDAALTMYLMRRNPTG